MPNIQSLFPVSSRRLHDRAIRLPSAEETATGTVLPFFDVDGVIERVMVLISGSTEIYFFDPTQQAPNIPLWGTIAFDDSYSGLRILNYENFDQLTHLWHYDPWWILTAKYAVQNPRALFLWQTNCVNSFLLKGREIEDVLYSRDLSRVKWVSSKKGKSTSWQRFQAKLLPPRVEAPAVPLPDRRGSSWELAPFWGSSDE